MSIRGSDFKLSANDIFTVGNWELTESVIDAAVLSAKKKYKYDEKGQKTEIQVGWSYKTYVPERNLIISVSVEDLACAIDTTASDIQQVKFSGFAATFYVDRKGFLQLSCKAEKAESVKK